MKENFGEWILLQSSQKKLLLILMAAPSIACGWYKIIIKHVGVKMPTFWHEYEFMWENTDRTHWH